MEDQRTTPPVRPTQLPVSQAVAGFAKMMGPPPKTNVRNPMMTPLKTSGADALLNPQEQAEEQSPVASDPLARAMLEQSRALATLVTHMQQGGDPLLDAHQASSSSSLGTRGSAGRERLQRELANKSGSFFLAVLQNAVRRLKPASRQPTSVQEISQTDFSMIQYLERFGGYGACKELGLIQYALAHIADALVHSDIAGAQDYLALLMVGVEQANLDSNRWELAYRMMLLEEPPSQLWSYRSRLNKVLARLGLPTTTHGPTKPLTLASFRPGGATYLIGLTESAELVRRRGRWVSMKVMEVYLQEVASHTFMTELKPDVLQSVLAAMNNFVPILTACVKMSQARLPRMAWHFLFQHSCEGVSMGQMGRSGKPNL
eukprot:Skav201145  [mRNA]  locus=scaffold2068:57644:63547:+ [translate_table: standard]